MPSGSFRTLTTRQSEDTATLTEGLGEGEWIKYWTRLPHSAARAVSTAAVTPDVDKRGRVVGVKFDAGAAAAVRLRIGIIAWHILDEAGNDVAWIPSKSAELIDGLDPGLIAELTKLIGAEDPEPALEEEAPNDGEGPGGETVGEDFAGSSEL